ncbi:MAG: tRNA uridine-5-carboxymethylaminomethyl(34) synthesis GTPase MnmE [Candidatus Omnitrophica bacterium]|nr:tRNA uridine-5-carboxymethylaminomethyl(34) synthesis GTPase MnmE [Candidatus Omnitrophota bacterium]
MSQLNPIDDTIVAIATGTGAGGIGIIRISGADAVSIADKIFKAKNKALPSSFKTFTVHYGEVGREKNSQWELIDEVLLTVMLAPKSYTCENVVEISCHGGSMAQRSILQLILDNGARLADPGEFTKRAFLNGRIDLAQAEAVLDVIRAKTGAYLRVSNNQLKGELSKKLDEIREEIMTVYVSVEALVNFPEDDTESDKTGFLKEHLNKAIKKVEQILAASEHGRILREGIRLVLCGKPNVGKSSILNKLLKQERAIVAEIAGTTRDPIEETAQIKGIPFQLVDTAGLIDPRDKIEQEAVKRSHVYIAGADLALLVLDDSEPLTNKDVELMEQLKGRDVIVIFNKIDLGHNIDEKKVSEFFPNVSIAKISAVTSEGLPALEDMIVQKIWHSSQVDTNGILVSNIRHIQSLKMCKQSLGDAANGLDQTLSLEFISEHIKSAVNNLDAITGKNIDADLLDAIFDQFCIGK